MIVHNHAKLVPLIPMPPDLLIYLLGFCDLNRCALYYHLALNPENYH